MRRYMAVAVLCVIGGALLGPVGVDAARKAATRVLITNSAKRAIPVKAQGTTPVSGKVGVDGTVPVTGKVGIDGSVPVTGKVGIDGTVPVSGNVGIDGTVPVTGSVGVSGPVDASGSTVSISPARPYQDNGAFFLDEGSSNDADFFQIPADKDLLVQYVSVNAEDTGAADIPRKIWLTGGGGTGAAAAYIPVDLVQTGVVVGSEMVQVLLRGDSASVQAFRNGTTGDARVEWSLSGYLVDEPAG